MIKVIVRLPKEEQQKAIKNKGIKPFSHGAKMGWIEINAKLVTESPFKWIKKGFEHAKILAKKIISNPSLSLNFIINSIL